MWSTSLWAFTGVPFHSTSQYATVRWLLESVLEASRPQRHEWLGGKYAEGDPQRCSQPAAPREAAHAGACSGGSPLRIFAPSHSWAAALMPSNYAFEQQRTVAYWLVEWNGTP